MSYVDSHCHLQFEKYSDPAAVVKRAKAAGVTKMLCVGTTARDSQQAAALANQFDSVWAAAGVHPHGAQDFQPEVAGRLAALWRQARVVAVGEIGLDYFKNYSSPAAQRRAFQSQFEAGLASRLPFIFHVRDAWDDFWRIYDSFASRRGVKGVIHSFSAHRPQLQQILERGLYVGLNGIMTFTKDQEQLAAAKAVPLANLILETDAPFLTPAPDRSRLCEPAQTAEIAEFLAGLRGEPLAKLAAATTANAEELFGI